MIDEAHSDVFGNASESSPRDPCNPETVVSQMTVPELIQKPAPLKTGQEWEITRSAMAAVATVLANMF